MDPGEVAAFVVAVVSGIYAIWNGRRQSKRIDQIPRSEVQVQVEAAKREQQQDEWMARMERRISHFEERQQKLEEKTASTVTKADFDSFISEMNTQLRSMGEKAAEMKGRLEVWMSRQ